MIELTKIFRQASESDIVVNAHKINRGEPVEINNKSRDFFFLKRYDADMIIRVVIALIQDKLPRYVNARPFEIQVLTPMRKGLLGVEAAKPDAPEISESSGWFQKGKNTGQTACSVRGIR